MTKIYEIPDFASDDFKLKKSYAFCADDKCMLICQETGTTLFLEQSLLKQIQSRQISDDMIFLLVQRAFADYKESRIVSHREERILPEFFLIDMTKACNLKCKYCFRESVGSSGHITAEKLKNICSSLIAYWKSRPELKLSIQAWGGEPLLELPLIIEMRRHFQVAELNPEIVIETNATLITPETAQLLHKNDIKIGISIDGNKAVHDVQRPFSNGNGSLNKVEEGIHNLFKAGYSDFGTISVVTQNTASHIIEIMDYFTKTLHLKSIKLNLMRKNEHNAEYALAIEKIGEYVSNLLDCLKNLYDNKISIVEQNISQRMANLMFRPNNNICNAHGCHGGYRMLSISSDGKVYPCELTDYKEFCMGGIENGDFADMVEKAVISENKYFENRNLESCKNCPWKYFCRGGCRASVKYMKNNTSDIDYTECVFNCELYPRLAKIILTEPHFAKYLLNGEF